METHAQKLNRVLKDAVVVVPYNPDWPNLFNREREHLLSCLSSELILRIEHFGSTAVPGMAAKPIIDMLVEVTSLVETKLRIAPVLESQGYDYFWRPTWGDAGPPYYAWFIRRDSFGNRTHHIHMVEGNFEHWDRLLFRDYLIEHPDVAQAYGALKQKLFKNHPDDREAYTRSKTAFVARVTATAKKYYA